MIFNPTIIIYASNSIINIHSRTSPTAKDIEAAEILLKLREDKKENDQIYKVIYTDKGFFVRDKRDEREIPVSSFALERYYTIFKLKTKYLHERPKNSFTDVEWKRFVDIFTQEGNLEKLKSDDQLTEEFNFVREKGGVALLNTHWVITDAINRYIEKVFY